MKDVRLKRSDSSIPHIHTTDSLPLLASFHSSLASHLLMEACLPILDLTWVVPSPVEVMVVEKAVRGCWRRVVDWTAREGPPPM